ncbi:Type I restriction-modification system, specificity subunit S, partial [Olavius algarvensis spirochete endosymbiont]|uniref:restriction endonuclease subunit S n=1 Tax=Olavius algarvensis spirochete endosymbiont TaxID=260710 RepID=UPI000F24F3B7
MSSDFTTVRLEQLGPIVTGKTPPKSIDKAFDQCGTPFITPKDMDGRKWIDATERYLSDLGLDAVKKSIVPRCSVAVSCIGSDMGKAVLVDCDSVTNQQINTILVDSEKWNPEYIYYLLTTKQQLLKDIAGGSATPILNKGHFGKVEIDVPSKELQDQAAKVLSAFDEKIRLNTQTNQTLEQIAQAIFK